MDVLKAQYEARAKDLEAAKAIVDLCAAEDRAMTVDERVAFDRTNEEFSRRTTMIEELKRMSAHEAEVRASQEGHEDQIRPVGQVVKPSNDVETIRSLARGEIRSAEFGMSAAMCSRRALARRFRPVLRPGDHACSRRRTDAERRDDHQYCGRRESPDPSTLDLLGRNRQRGGCDPRRVRSRIQCIHHARMHSSTGSSPRSARELLEDSGVDILALLAQNCGNALGFAVNTALTTGTDTTEPNGVVTASGFRPHRWHRPRNDRRIHLRESRVAVLLARSGCACAARHRVHGEGFEHRCDADAQGWRGQLRLPAVNVGVDSGSCSRCPALREPSNGCDRRIDEVGHRGPLPQLLRQDRRRYQIGSFR
jgi:hypothetical protein